MPTRPLVTALQQRFPAERSAFGWRSRRRAGAVFQALTGNPAHNPVLPHNVLAWLGLARARAQAGDLDGSRLAYERFLHLWRDADPDVPVRLEARAELAALGS
jgi:eukaryotic-like serine/threonine-protein kinase